MDLKNLFIFLYVTDYCTKGCDHCYNPTVESNMSLETANRTIEWIRNVCMEEKIKSLRMAFLGGEPLNNVNVLLHIVDKLDWIKPLPPDGYMVLTNGDLLTDELLKEFKSRKLRVLINPTHDSLKEIERKTIQVKSICGGCSYSVVLNDFNMPRITDIAKLAVKYRCQMRINRLYDGGLYPEYIKEYGKQMKKVMEILLSSERPIYPNWIIESSRATWTDYDAPYACGKWLTTVATDGSLRSCNPDISTIHGHIDTTKHWSDLTFHQKWSAENLPECQGCQYLPFCQGGCPYTRKLTYGTYDKKSPFCGEFKKLFPLLIKLTERWKESKIGV
jgi:uncharacterized protein